jgi:hypothetical protein
VAFDQFNKEQFGGCIHISMAADPSAYRSIADAPLQWQRGLETGCEITVDLRSDGLLCWPYVG